MTIEYLGVRGDITGSRDALTLIVRGDLPLFDSCKIVIERPGQNRPYLAESGWQSNYQKCLIDVVRSGEVDFYLCLPLSFARYLDSEHNYKIELFDLSDLSVGTFGMNWTPPPRPRGFRVEPVTPAPVKVEDDPPKPEPIPEPIFPEPEVVLYMPPGSPLKKREVVNCVHCGGQIFSTFSVCPYCGTPHNTV
jgi:hypothetical protein